MSCSPNLLKFGVFFEGVNANGRGYSVRDNVLSGQVELEATTEDLGTTLRAPTLEAGLAPACKDTCFGTLKLQMWERRSDGTKGKVWPCLWCS